MVKIEEGVLRLRLTMLEIRLWMSYLRYAMMT